MNKISRRSILSSGAAVIAGAPGLLSQRNVNNRLGLAMIGVGTRGFYLLDQFQRCPNTEVRVICDIYDGNLRRAQENCTNKKALITNEWEKAVSSKDVDAVVIATPDFWHAPMTTGAAEHGKHVYVEKGLCRTLAEAKAVRKAVRENKVTLQLGHHQNSDPYFNKAKEIVASGKLGNIALVRTYIDRTSPWPEWKFYTTYNIHETPKDASPETIDWERFIAIAPQRPFDVERFFLWRCWWDYGTGIAGDLMSHQWDGVNMILSMGIPESVITQGSLYFWTEDRDVPDQWHVLYDYPKKQLAVTFACAFHNSHQGTNTYFLGRDATLEVHTRWCRLYGAEWKPEYEARFAAARKAAIAAGRGPYDASVLPDYAMKKGEIEVTTHMQNFVDCVRSGETPRCGMERAFEEAVTIAMSVESHFKERRVKWDPVSEQIV